MKRKVNITILALLIAFITVLSGCHFGRGQMSGVSVEKKADFAVNYIAKELDFSSKQKDEIVRIKEDIIVKMKEHKQDREDSKSEIIAMIRSNNISEESLDVLFESQMEKKRQMKPFFVEKIIEFNNILTDEQRNKIADHIENNKFPKTPGHM